MSNINKNNNNNKIYSLPQSHKSIKDKFTNPEINFDSDCELILFELPKNFNRELIEMFEPEEKAIIKRELKEKKENLINERGKIKSEKKSKKKN